MRFDFIDWQLCCRRCLVIAHTPATLFFNLFLFFFIYHSSDSSLSK